MTRWIVMVAVILLLLLTTGCGGRRSSYGFQLPDGNADAGRAAFAQLDCASCHRVDGVDLPAPQMVPAVVLGGPVPVIPTDGELTTGIINPSAHFAPGYPPEVIRVGGHSRMPDYTHEMSVRQMADLVAFLHSRYEYAPVPQPIR